jgi:hypothetical protein
MSPVLNSELQCQLWRIFSNDGNWPEGASGFIYSFGLGTKYFRGKARRKMQSTPNAANPTILAVLEPGEKISQTTAPTMKRANTAITELVQRCVFSAYILKPPTMLFKFGVRTIIFIRQLVAPLSAAIRNDCNWPFVVGRVMLLTDSIRLRTTDSVLGQLPYLRR